MLCLLFVILLYAHALNLDKQNPRIFSGPKGSYFGFSIDFYEAADKGLNIVVGAPRMNTSQPGVRNGGGVFLCPWGPGSNSCSIIPFDQTGDKNDTTNGIMRIFKSDQWLGATVRTWKTSIVACAPYQHFNYIDSIDWSRESGKTPTGACYLTADLKNFYEFAPCREIKIEAVHQSSYVRDKRYCEIGFSAEISKNGTLLAGAPGGYFFEGLFTTVPLYSIWNIPMATIKKYSGLEFSTENLSAMDTYKGFSVAYGEFTMDNQTEIVVGCPNVADVGAVEIFSGVKSILIIHGDQTASYFGHSLAVTDINNDGYDDLVVGAPVFMERVTGGKLKEVGQVHVYMQKRQNIFDKEHQILTGTYIYGQFGAAIIPLGDLDKDGYNDVAVGSPFGGKSGGGCVYIYKGEKSGLSAQPSQILESPLHPPSRFGFALRGGVDIDGNGYPDLIVGAFEEDTVYVFRAQPVVLLQTSMYFSPDTLNPDLKLCKHRGSEAVSCFTLGICSRAPGKSLPKTISLEVDIQLDSQKNRFLRRTVFNDTSLPSKTTTIILQSNTEPVCNEFTVYLRDEVEFKDKLSPIVVSVNFSQMRTEASSVLPPVIHGNTILQEQIHILLDCGEDKVCIPDLHLSASWREEPLVIGSDNLVHIYFTATNLGEGAYEAELNVHLPPGAHYMQVLREAEEKILCTPKKANETELVVCELGNPMKTGTKVYAGLQLSFSNLEDIGSNISFPMHIKSRNSQNSSSPIVWVQLNVTVKISLDLRGNSHPAEVILPLPNWEPKEESNKPQDKGEEVIHVYELHNAGPGTVHVKFVVQSPENYEDDLFLYPLLLKTDNNMRCTNLSNINFLQLDLMGVTEAPVNYKKSDGRKLSKRDVARGEQVTGSRESGNQTSKAIGPILVNCSDSRCWQIECFIQNMEKGERATVKLQSILWVSSFLKRPQQQITLRSRGYFEVMGVPYRIQPAALIATETFADTVVQWVSPDGQKEIPMWWIILGILGGLLILALLIFVMWKVGFFRRTRPPTDDQEELTNQ
ncbi:integrin alpha-IIb [Pseudophryne corroboree]|uniref:integrin alpha-IIb n=1 Tax=Pseudophryne corroboree TaxID=495146 RepID=UPI003081E39B